MGKSPKPGLVDDGLKSLTYKVIGLAMAVHNDLGPGRPFIVQLWQAASGMAAAVSSPAYCGSPKKERRRLI